MNGMANGRGTFIDSKGSTYDGEWLNDQQHGYGRETWDQGRIKFEGQYYQGKKNGRGRYEWADGSFYEGDFVDSVFTGQGKKDIQILAVILHKPIVAECDFTALRMSSNVGFSLLGVYYFAESERTYEGSFSQNLFEGKGKLTYKDGRMYEGDFKAGKKDGNGTMILPNGNKYIGQWENDCKHGIGVWYTAKDGVKKQG